MLATPTIRKQSIDQAAHEAATSFLNLHRPPTEAQARAGNYRKGHVRISGLDISIENPAGSKRKSEWPTLQAHYGYIKGTQGADDGHLDVFVRPGTPEDWDGDLYVIDQHVDGKFDEHKIMLGWDSEADARKAYLANYERDWDGIGAVTRMAQDEFKEWMEGDTTQAVQKGDVPGHEFHGNQYTRGTDFAASLALHLQEKTGSIFGRWEGKMSAQEQRALFGRFIGKGTIVIDGKEEAVANRVSVGFGQDYDYRNVTAWRDLNKPAHKLHLTSHDGKLCGCSLHKGTPVDTPVKLYVEAKQPKVSRKIARLLKEHGKAIATRAAELYGKGMQKLAKDATTDELVQAILDELDAQGVAVDVVDSITPELVRAFAKAGVLGVGQVGIGMNDDITNHLDKAALDYAEAHGAELVKDLAGTTLDDLRGAISDAVEQGMSTDELASNIEDLGAFGEARADTIARTELATAHVQGNVEGLRSTGLQLTKRWILGDLHDVTDECDDNADDEEIDFEEAFSSGDMWPPAHPNCTCDFVATRVEEDQPTEETA